MPEILELNDVLALLRQRVEEAGGQVAWSKMTGTNRTVLNKVLGRRRPPTAGIITALGLRIVFTPENIGRRKSLPIRERAFQKLVTTLKPRS